MRFLLVEDSAQLARAVCERFALDGHAVDHATGLIDASAFVDTTDYNLILLDIMLPDGDGRDFCRWMRDMGYTIPVLMLTAQSSEMDTIDGLEAGANDYIAKPVRMGELIARMKTHLIQHQAREDARITIGAFQFSNSRKTMVHIDSGEVINLTEKEAAIIKHLHLNRDKVVNKKALLEQVWGYGDGVTTHTLETHIYRLRQKIRYVDETDFLITSGGGYMLA